MSILEALLLGVIQGLTEFLPISSSGHLLLFEKILGINSGGLFFNVLLHFASLIAVVIVFWKDIIDLIKKPFGEKMQTIIVATIPTIIIALIVNYNFDEFRLNAFLGFGFLLSAIIILITMIKRKQGVFNTGVIKNKNAFIIGIVQGVAVLPGISRSGSTICAGLLQGKDREECAKFSFLISLPVILGGVLLKTYDGINVGFGEINWFACIVGFIASFVVAIFTIKFMMKIVKHGNWWYFSVYLFILSLFVLLNQYVFCWF